jgi:uncharacterized membrane protein YgcG
MDPSNGARFLKKSPFRSVAFAMCHDIIFVRLLFVGNARPLSTAEQLRLNMFSFDKVEEPDTFAGGRGRGRGRGRGGGGRRGGRGGRF